MLFEKIKGSTHNAVWKEQESTYDFRIKRKKMLSRGAGK